MRGDSIVTRNFVNLGIAVELAEGKGLIVPVLRNAEGLNLLGLAQGHRRHREQGAQQAARPGRRPGRHVHDHEPRRLRHVPRHAGDQPAAVGDPRHVRAREAAVGRQDELGKDVIAIRPLMNITLTYDHRLVDGAYAGRFLRDLRERLEGWEGDGEQSAAAACLASAAPSSADSCAHRLLGRGLLALGLAEAPPRRPTASRPTVDVVEDRAFDGSVRTRSSPQSATTIAGASRVAIA